MVIFISLLTAVLFVLLFEKPLKKNPIPFYVISAILSLATIIIQAQGIAPGGFVGEYIFPMFSKAGLGTSFFVLVMYASTFKNGSEPIKLLMPLRGQLSISGKDTVIHPVSHNVYHHDPAFRYIFYSDQKKDESQGVEKLAALCVYLLRIHLLPHLAPIYKRRTQRRCKVNTQYLYVLDHIPLVLYLQTNEGL